MLREAQAEQARLATDLMVAEGKVTVLRKWLRSRVMAEFATAHGKRPPQFSGSDSDGQAVGARVQLHGLPEASEGCAQSRAKAHA